MISSDNEQALAAQAAAMVKAVYDDGEAEINGRVYVFTKMVHKDRRKVFAYLTHIMPQLQTNDMGFMDSPEFEPVERVINKSVTVDGALLKVIEADHWDKHPGDYIPFISTALQVISFPFMSAVLTG